ncbi:MAG: PorT family protein [Bacteroidota bacterium]|nr:PorT family protein [Bacteroidota bacterium]
MFQKNTSKIKNPIVYKKGKPVIIALILLILVTQTKAQEKQMYREDRDFVPYYFGLSLGYNNSYLHPEKNPLFLQNDSVLSVEPGASGGIALGLLATARLNKRFEVRFHPQLILGGSKYLTYVIKYPTPIEPAIQKKTIPSTIVSFPLQMKFNSDRIGNFRVYMLGGLKYDIDVASNAGALDAENLIKLKKTYVGYEAGLGFNFYFPVVTIAPEIKVSNGLTNVHDRDANLKYSNILNQLQSRMITFSLIFER